MDAETISGAIREAFVENLEGTKAQIVQSLIFSKTKFNRSSARTWAKDHGYKASKVEITKHSLKLRQLPPGRCVTGSLRTEQLTKGVSAIMAQKKAKE